MDTQDCDFLVIGSGIAGLTFALRCAAHGNVMVVTKAELHDTNTSYAQGGVAAAMGEDDSWKLHEEDTLKAGAGLNDPAAVRFLVQNARRRLEWLIELGARFDPATEGELPGLSLGMEGGHSRERIVHSADQTGWEIERVLTVAAQQNPNIQIREYAFCEALSSDGSRCTGAFIRPKNETRTEIRSRATCLATGSCCRVYRFTTNPPIATGDGIALAVAVDAELANMEFIQFHPTTLYHRIMRSFLISEAVRGEGAILRTIHGRRFMFDYDPRGELAPRDIVARAVHAEALKEGVPFVHLDMTHLTPDEIQLKFPHISETLLSLGIDVSCEPIPVVPAAHYQCGGVVTDLSGRTSVNSLYAAGEVAYTGVHGANRLASNSLIEALIFGWAAAEHAVESGGEITAGSPAKPTVPAVDRNDREGMTRRLRRMMWEHAGIVRNEMGLRHAEEEIEEMIATTVTAPEFYAGGAEAAGLLECGRQIIRAARARRVNVGLHYNEDLGPPWEEVARQRAGKA